MKSCDLVGGRIRTECSRCSKITYTEVAPDTREKIVRCSCGKSENYQVNNRQSTRDSYAGSAEVLYDEKRETKIHLVDASDAGIGFFVTKEIAGDFFPGQEITFRNRSPEGSVAQRKMVITSVHGNRIGARYPN